MGSSQNNMTTQLKAILRKNKENMQKAVEKVLGQMQENIERDITFLIEQHMVKSRQNRVEIQACFTKSIGGKK